MDWAHRCAQLSHAKRLQVGAVIVKDDSVISYGYNGMPAGWDNNCEDKIYCDDGDLQFEEELDTWKRYKLKTKPEVLHAESNAVSKLAKSSNSGDGADIFITHAPCLDCAKLVYQAGIKRVYFGTAYRDDAGIKFLVQSGVTIEQIK